MTEQSISPDYELPDRLELTEPAQYRALFQNTRLKIADLLLERAATTSELAVALDRPKGTVSHHLKTMEEAGLVHVVRTKRVRAIEAKYYGRTARVFMYERRERHAFGEANATPASLLAAAAAELDAISPRLAEAGLPTTTLVRHARIPVDRAHEWDAQLAELASAFASQPRAGDVTFGMVVAVYPTERPRLPEEDA